MIRYFALAGLLISCTGLPLRAGSAASEPPATASTSPHAKDSAVTADDKAMAKTSPSVVKTSSSPETATVSVSTSPHAKDAAVKAEDKSIAKISPSPVKPSSSPETATASASTSPHAKDPVGKAQDKAIAQVTPAIVKPVSPLHNAIASAPSTPKINSTPSHLKSRASTVSKNCTVASNEARLARLTAYWASEGDHYTSLGIASTGIHLRDGYCAVDPRIIPYGSVVTISGVGKYLAVDTGSAVISREAARETGHTPEERAALVIDLYFESRRDGENFAASGPKFAAISWQAPNSSASVSSDGRDMVAEAEWNKLRNKQLSE